MSSTDTLDRLYLELSLITQARNARERRALNLIRRLYLKCHYGNPGSLSDLLQESLDYITDEMSPEGVKKWLREEFNFKPPATNDIHDTKRE